MAQWVPPGKQTFVGLTGAPLVGGKVHHYIPGTDTRKTTWSTIAKTAQNTNPVILDARGQAMIFGEGLYRQVLTDALDNEIWDRVTGTDGSGLVGGVGAFVDTVATGEATEFTDEVQFLLTSGYYDTGDGGGAEYKRVLAEPAHGGKFQSADGAWWELAEATPSTQQFGVKHDDATDNGVTLAGAMEWLALYPGSTLLISPGTARTTVYQIVPDFSRLQGMAESSWIENAYAGGGPDQWSCPLWLGTWHPYDYGHRAAGSGGAWTRLVTRYRASGVVTADDVSVTLATPGDAANFTPGEIYVLVTNESAIQVAGADEYEIPNEQSLVRVTAANAVSGVVTFDYSAGFTSATAPWLCKINAGAQDPVGPVYFAQGIVLDGFGIRGLAAFGTTATGAFECSMLNCQFDCTHFLIVNGFAHCTVRNCRGSFERRGMEFKFGAHDSQVSGIQAWTHGDGSTVPGMISTGENCRNIAVEEYDIIAPLWDGAGHLFQLQSGNGCTFTTGRMFAPAHTNTPIQFYSSDVKVLTGVIIDGLDLSHGSSVAVVFANDLAFDPEVNTVNNLRETSYNTGGSYIGVFFLGGERNSVMNSNFHKGGFIFGTDAIDNVAFNNTTPGVAVGGAGAAANCLYGFGFSGGVMTAYVSGGGLPPYFIARGFTSGSVPADGGGKFEWVDNGIDPPYVRIVSDDGAGVSSPMLLYANRTSFVKSSGGSDTLIGSFETAQLAPGVDNVTACGHPSFRWTVVYAATGAINTSDEREKTAPLDIPDALLDAVEATELVGFQRLSSVEEKGDKARIHAGIMAQELHRQCLKAGIPDPFVYGVLCFDQWPDEYETVVDARGMGRLDSKKKPMRKLVRKAGSRWGIRPDEWHFLCEAARRRKDARTAARITALEDRIAALGG